jgi:hypothetical protein
VYFGDHHSREEQYKVGLMNSMTTVGHKMLTLSQNPSIWGERTHPSQDQIYRSQESQISRPRILSRSHCRPRKSPRQQSHIISSSRSKLQTLRFPNVQRSCSTAIRHVLLFHNIHNKSSCHYQTPLFVFKLDHAFGKYQQPQTRYQPTHPFNHSYL